MNAKSSRTSLRGRRGIADNGSDRLVALTIDYRSKAIGFGYLLFDSEPEASYRSRDDLWVSCD